MAKVVQGKSERSFPAFVFPLKQSKTANAVTQTPHTHTHNKHTLKNAHSHIHTFGVYQRANTKKW